MVYLCSKQKALKLVFWYGQSGIFSHVGWMLGHDHGIKNNMHWEWDYSFLPVDSIVSYSDQMEKLSFSRDMRQSFGSQANFISEITVHCFADMSSNKTQNLLRTLWWTVCKTMIRSVHSFMNSTNLQNQNARFPQKFSRTKQILHPNRRTVEHFPGWVKYFQFASVSLHSGFDLWNFWCCGRILR